MDRESKFEVALKGLVGNWGSKPPSSHEKRALDLLLKDSATTEAWSKLECRKPRTLKPDFQQEVLRSILKNFDLCESQASPGTMLRIDKEFKTIQHALETLIQYFGQQAGIHPSTVKVYDACPGSEDLQNIWHLRQMQEIVLIRYDLDIFAVVSRPIVSETCAPADRALNYACCLAEYMENLSGRRPYLGFSMAIAGILYGGTSFDPRTLDNHRKERKRRRSSALERSNSLAFQRTYGQVDVLASNVARR